LSSSSVPRDLLPDIQTEEDLQAIFEANSGSTDNTDTAISQTEHNTDTETEADATMSETDNITDTNTDTDGQVTAHNSTDNNEPTIELETESMVIELRGHFLGVIFLLLILVRVCLKLQILTSNVHERWPFLANRCTPIPWQRTQKQN
jgi:hypothetical protein